MKFNVSALSATIALIWGGAVLLVAASSLVWPGYGGAFLDFAASIYPGYEPAPTLGSVIIGTLYALVDGAIGGAIFGWLYNLLSRNA